MNALAAAYRVFRMWGRQLSEVQPMRFLRGTPIRVRETVLDEAKRLVDGDRDQDYGHPSIIYARVGRVWGAILGIPDIPPATVCLMLAGMKVARHAERKKRDNLTDTAGYVRCVEMCEDLNEST